jgi:hypothetical protein
MNRTYREEEEQWLANVGIGVIVGGIIFLAGIIALIRHFL